MTNSQQPKAPMHAVKVSSAPMAIPSGGDSEARAARSAPLAFTNVDKRRILQAADLRTKPGEVGALMRRAGVYPSSLGACRTWGVDAKFGPSEDSFCRICSPMAVAMRQKAG